MIIMVGLNSLLKVLDLMGLAKYYLNFVELQVVFDLISWLSDRLSSSLRGL